MTDQETPDTEAKLALCRGCRDDFYNGHNELGVQRCWSLKSATVVERVAIYVDRCPPYKNMKAEKTLSCHSRPRHVMVKPEAINAEGYWKS